MSTVSGLMNGAQGRTSNGSRKKGAVAFRTAHTGSETTKTVVLSLKVKKRNLGQIRGYREERGWLWREQKAEAPAMLQHGRACKEPGRMIRYTGALVL